MYKHLVTFPERSTSANCTYQSNASQYAKPGFNLERSFSDFKLILHKFSLVTQ